MRLSIILGLVAALSAGAALAHGDHDHECRQGKEAAADRGVAARRGAQRQRQVSRRRQGGGRRIRRHRPVHAQHGLALPQAGIASTGIDLQKPEFLVYADDPCGGKRKLVAVEYVVPSRGLAAARRRAVFSALPMSGTRTRLSSCGRCMPGCTSSTRTACSRPSIRAFPETGTQRHVSERSGDCGRLSVRMRRPATAPADPALPRAALREWSAARECG